MSTKAHVMLLAEQRADLDSAIEYMGAMNSPTDIGKRVRAAAELAVLRDKREAINMEYHRVFSEWQRRGFPENEPAEGG